VTLAAAKDELDTTTRRLITALQNAEDLKVDALAETQRRLRYLTEANDELERQKCEAAECASTSANSLAAAQAEHARLCLVKYEMEAHLQMQLREAGSFLVRSGRACCFCPRRCSG